MLTALQQSLGLIFWQHQWYFVAIAAQKSRVSATESRWRTENARACGDPARTVVGPSRSPGPCLPQSRESRLRCHCDPCPVYNAARWPRALPSPTFRPTTDWLTRGTDRVVNLAFRAAARHTANYRKRDRTMSAHAATLLICQLIAWLLVFYVVTRCCCGPWSTLASRPLLPWPGRRCGPSAKPTSTGPLNGPSSTSPP